MYLITSKFSVCFLIALRKLSNVKNEWSEFLDATKDLYELRAWRGMHMLLPKNLRIRVFTPKKHYILFPLFFLSLPTSTVMILCAFFLSFLHYDFSICIFLIIVCPIKWLTRKGGACIFQLAEGEIRQNPMNTKKQRGHYVLSNVSSIFTRPVIRPAFSLIFFYQCVPDESPCLTTYLWGFL